MRRTICIVSGQSAASLHTESSKKLFHADTNVMNSNCIDMRTLGMNIYMYRKGKIYKEPHEEIQ
jgi:hypothetical protein